jgi:membrane dipeptidase
MQRFGLVLDVSHMSDEACRAALDSYDGPIIASHSNPRRIVPSLRQLPDDTIKQLAERDGMVGIMPLNWALDPDWRTKTKAGMTLEHVVDAIDVVCELSGDALHVGVGSDFDGGQGAEATPAELDTIADLPLLAGALANRGYDAAAVEAIMSGNWLRLLRRHLPAGPAAS